MSDLHAALGILVLTAAVAFTLIAAAAARFTSMGSTAASSEGAIPRIEWIERFRVGLTVAILIQMSLGALLYAQEHRPAETIHLLYGLAAVVALPLGSTLASEAPPRARLWVLAVFGAATAGLLWRLWGTG